MNRDKLTRTYLRRIQKASGGSLTAVENAISTLKAEQNRSPTIDEVVQYLEKIRGVGVARSNRHFVRWMHPPGRSTVLPRRHKTGKASARA